MPYIPRSARSRDPNIPATHPGELNFLFTAAIVDYIKEKGLSYQTINDVVGALESCKLEFYRRVAVDYEDKAIERNGDVYTPSLIES